MINIDQEKNRTIGTSDALAVLDFATQAADRAGFVSSFIFNRAFIMYTISMLHPDRSEEIAAGIAKDFGGMWDTLMEDGTIEKLLEDNAEDVKFMSEVASEYYVEYTDYALSARGLLDFIQSLAGDTLATAKSQLLETINGSGADEVINFANKWGMNNDLSDSLFNKNKQA